MPTDIELGFELSCFIVSPIGNKLEPIGSPGRSRYEESITIWEEIFEPACAAFGLIPVRADRIAEPGEIPDQIFTYLRDADVVIADLSHANPNVMYELGLRHSQSNKLTLQIGEYNQLPFDVTTIRTIQFNRTAAGLIGLRDDLIVSLRAALNGNSGTPLRATAIFAGGPAVHIEDLSADAAKSVAPDAAEPESSGPGTLDLLAEGEEALAHIVGVLTESTATLQTVGALTKASTESIGISDSQSKGFAGRLVIARKLASDLEQPGHVLEGQSNDFYSDVTLMDSMIQFIVKRLESGEENAAETVGFLTSIVSLVDSAAEAAVGIAKFREGSRSLSSMSKVLVDASKSLNRSTSRFLEGITIMSAWKPAVQSLLDNIGE